MWKINIDTGGTFTDCIASSPKGETKRYKLLSSGKLRGTIVKEVKPGVFHIGQNWNIRNDILTGFDFNVLSDDENAYKIESFNPQKSLIALNNPVSINQKLPVEFEIFTGEEAPILACRILTETPLSQSLPQLELCLGSTRGTNALLENKGTCPTLIVTKGFKDLLRIGTQQRPQLFQLNIKKSTIYAGNVFEVNERIDAQGTIIENLDKKEVENLVREIKRSGSDTVAVSLLNAYKNNAHELAIKKALDDNNIKYQTISSLVEPSINYLLRTQTTVINSYLYPVLFLYLFNIKSKLTNDSIFRIITSVGGLSDANIFLPKDSLLSGPAGGVVGTASIAKQTGYPHILAFDMGGTSTDVSRFHEQYDYKFETKVGDAVIKSPCLNIETIAAGGGSVCGFDGSKFTVGPESAGANPGPACYGNGGPLAITDVNLLLGRINQSRFRIPLNLDNSKNALYRLKEDNRAIADFKNEEILSGFLRIANEKMAEAIRKISVRKGYDPSMYALLAFGGAGALHACDIAEMLNIKKIIIPFDAGILSAVGISHSVIEKMVTKQVLEKLTDVGENIAPLLNELRKEAFKQLEQNGMPEDLARVSAVKFYLRFRGQDFTLEIDYRENINLQKEFKEKYIKTFGHWVEGQILEVESVKLIASSIPDEISQVHIPENETKALPSGKQIAFFNNHWAEVPVFDVTQIEPGQTIKGPCIILNDNNTGFINEAWEGRPDNEFNLIIEMLDKEKIPDKEVLGAEEIQLELYTRRFESIVNDMGALLQRTAFSVNIKERMDFSCALLDANGYLVANAPHIPVHLGAMGICCREVVKHISIEENDVIITNHPGFGGSHLPDVTLIAPVHCQGKLIGYVANRAHHAELGGIAPGSMPANARNLSEEGVVISPFKIIKKGKEQFYELRSILTSGTFPTRSVNENMADVNAALASVNIGKELLQQGCRNNGAGEVVKYMDKLRRYSLYHLKASLVGFNKKEYLATEFLDDGSPISVKISIDKYQCLIDFSGSAPQHPGNLNATPAIVTSAVLYFLRLLVKKEIPLNEGVLQYVKINIPRGMLNPDFLGCPVDCPPVVGGNVETSQRIVDALLKALGMVACSQGTMNNLIFGNRNFGFYETICGGTGAGEGFHGADAVHQHMTNTKITDPEIMEQRYPVMVEEFSVRKGSGGKGKWHGGDGIKRVICYTEDVTLSVLSQHRKETPYGINGGSPGELGNQYIKTNTEEIVSLRGIDKTELQKGDKIVIETPGGGGFGVE